MELHVRTHKNRHRVLSIAVWGQFEETPRSTWLVLLYRGNPYNFTKSQHVPVSGHSSTVVHKGDCIVGCYYGVKVCIAIPQKSASWVGTYGFIFLCAQSYPIPHTRQHTGPLIRNTKSGLDWISCSREGDLNTYFKITTADFFISYLRLNLPFLIAGFL